MAETYITTAISALISGKVEFRSTDTTRNNNVPPVYRAGKFTYVTHDDDLEYASIEVDPETVKTFSDEEVHFGGKWLETLVGVDLDFYGAESQAFKVDGVVFEVLEDPDDGYRSHMAGILARSEKDYNFYSKPFATVRLEKIDVEERDDYSCERMHGYKLVDNDDGHVWLTFGTEWYDDYYPMFRFEYTPKENVNQS